MKTVRLRAAAVVASLVATAAAQQGPHTVRPNVLLIVLDDVGQDKLAVYQPPVPTPPTPNLTQLAQAGIRFTRAYVDPLCSPTRAALLTGRYSFRTGMGHLSTGYPLPASEVTIAERLKSGFPGQTPYACGAFGKWHVATESSDSHPIEQGFDVFAGSTIGVPDHFYWRHVEASVQGVTSTMIGSVSGPFDETTFSASVTEREALSWIRSVHHQPFFAYVCFNAPHAPFQVPPPSLVSQPTRDAIAALGCTAGQDLGASVNLQRAYDWLLEAVDTEIGRLLAGISPSVRANTIVVVVSDNGTPVQIITAPPYDPTHAKATVYEQGTLVPFLVAGRGITAVGTACEGLVSVVDVWPTVAALTGAQPHAGAVIDGVSFRHLLRDPTLASARTQAFVQLYWPCGAYVPDPAAPPPGLGLHLRAMHDGRYKYVRRGVLAPVEEAYDLAVDPLETQNLWPVLHDLPPSVQSRIASLRTSTIALSGF